MTAAMNQEQMATTSFEHWLATEGDWVELPNERRGGQSGVQRLKDEAGKTLYRKYQVNHCYRDLKHPLGEPTIRREQRALLAFSALGVKVPEIVFCGTRKHQGHWEALLVTEELQGFVSLESLYESGAVAQWSDSVRSKVFEQLGQLLARLHAQRWQHGCLYPKHIFVHQTGDEVCLALLDLEKTRQRWTVQQAARHDLSQLRRRSTFSAADWAKLMAAHEQVLGYSIASK